LVVDVEGVWAVIPAYNEAASLPGVIERVHAAGLRCLVVDDGSSDASAQVAREAGVDDVVSHPVNRGYAAALATGLHAAAKEPGCRWVVTLDADGQLDPAEAASLVAAADAAGVDVAVGIRPAPARVSERFAAGLASTLFGIIDPLCGLKAYRPSIIQRFSASCGRRVGMELAVRAAAAWLGVLQRPVSIRPAARHGSRYGRGLWSEVRIVAATLALLACAVEGIRS
jgi:glycosyltransferase involved in cell wall biosynthesis